MKINSIDIVNFRGFQHETREFKTNLTVVLGNNTAGKTTLLKALQVGLGAYLQCLSKLPRAAQYRRNFSIHDRFMAFDDIERDYVPNPERTKISIKANFYSTDSIENMTPHFAIRDIAWSRKFTGNSTTHSLQKDQLISFDDDVLPKGEPYRESLEDITSHRMGLKQDICSQR